MWQGRDHGTRITVIYNCVLSKWDVFMGNCQIYILWYLVMGVMRTFVILKHLIYYLIAKHIDNYYFLTLLVNPVCLEGTVLNLIHICWIMVSGFCVMPNLHDLHWLVVCVWHYLFCYSFTFPFDFEVKSSNLWQL